MRLGAEGQVLNPIDIAFRSDGVLLKGKLHAAEGEGPFPTVILLHGFPDEENDVLGLGRRMSIAGINALTFNYGGTHQSEGEYSIKNTQSEINAAYKFIHKPQNLTRFRVDARRIFLGGHSFGGGMALTYAANHPEITRVFSIAGNDHGEFAREYRRNATMAEMIDAWFKELEAPSGSVRFKGKVAVKDLLDNADLYDLRKSAPLLANRNILLVGGWDDEQVTIESYLLPLYRALKKEGASDLRFVVYQTNHSFENVGEELAEEVVGWIRSLK
jgi:dienelactone hydrolase